MIEQAMVSYLNSVPEIVTALGGQKVYFRRVTANEENPVKMPWCIITNSGGSRKRQTLNKMEPRDTLTLDIYHYDQFMGREAAEVILRALENYRGDMPPEQDLHVTCGTIRDLDAYQDSYRFVLPVYVRYRQTITFPNAGS